MLEIHDALTTPDVGYLNLILFDRVGMIAASRPRR
jgi:hypothetical protein